MKNIYLTKEYYGAKAFGAEWEEMKKTFSQKCGKNIKTVLFKMWIILITCHSIVMDIMPLGMK